MLKRNLIKIIIVFIFLSCFFALTHSVQAATSRRTATNEHISTYGTTCGGTCDYTVLATWEAATDIDLVAATQSEVLECYDDAASYDDYDTLDGAVTSSSYFRIIRPASGQGHDGTPNNGVTFIVTADAYVIAINENYSRAQDIIGKLNINSGTDRIAFKCYASENSFVGCIAFDVTNNGAGQAHGFMAVAQAGETQYFINCLAHNCKTDGFQDNQYGSVYFYNCTSQGNGRYGFQQVNATPIAKNCCASGNTTADWSGTWTQTTCTAEGANPTYVDSANDDFHLASGDTVCKDQGTDLSADATFAFDDDINDGTMGAGKAGESRSGTWDIGFDEYLFAPTITSVIHTPSTVKPSSVITFSVDWNDGDSGENIKAKICKTNSLTNQNCDGGHWATSTAFTTSDPEQVTYTAQEADKGSHHDYYAFVCDDGGLCSGSTYGAFYVGYGTQINSPLTGKFESGLVGYWSFNGADMDWASTTAEALDRSGQGNNGNAVNGPAPAIGISGQALDFDGSDDYVNVGDISSTDNLNAITISVWLSTDAITDGKAHPFVSKYDADAGAGNKQYLCRLNSNQTVLFVISNDGTADNTHTSTTAISALTWTHIVCLYNGTIMTIYLNGVQSGSTNYSSGIKATSDEPLYIGKRRDTDLAWTAEFSGSIDEVAIYNRALSADEVLEHYRAGARKLQPDTPFQPKGESGLVGYWSFNGQDVDWASTTAEVLDRSGEGNNGNVTNFGKEAVRAGISGQALEFDGSNDYVDCGDITAFELDAPFTLSVWLSAGNTSGNHAFIAKYNTASNQREYYFDVVNGAIRFWKSRDGTSTANDQAGTSSTITQDVWYHYTFTLDQSGNFAVYLDGRQDNSGSAFNTTIFHGTAPATFGGVYYVATTPDYEYDGLIDEVRIYNRALSADEVMEQYRVGARKFKISN